jgi:DNA topoisomerase-1
MTTQSRTGSPTAARVAIDRPDPRRSARRAGLRYTSDDRPGISRRRSGRGFSYRDADGKTVRARSTLARIRALAIPPAWTDVWICPDPDGHLQATGRDARGRKQYRYHAAWRTGRDDAKFERILAFAAILPRIRRRCDRDLARRSLTRAKVLAAVVRLLELTLIRVGNDEYARLNRSFGLTTLRDRHVTVEGTAIRFRFRGKSGRQHEVSLRDRRLAGVVKRCQELPGQELFQYVDDAGQMQDVTSEDVNDYLREAARADVTAKDFRIWAGTVLAYRALCALDPAGGPAAARRNVVEAVRLSAGELGNTPAVARRSYVHPAILDAYLDGSIPDGALVAPVAENGRRNSDSAEAPSGWSPDPAVERAVVRLLERLLQGDAGRSSPPGAGARPRQRPRADRKPRATPSGDRTRAPVGSAGPRSRTGPSRGRAAHGRN